MCTSWSSGNKISNFKISAFFRVLFAFCPQKYPHPKSQQTPWVSTELEMAMKSAYSFIPLQKLWEKKVAIAWLKTRRSARKYNGAEQPKFKLISRMRGQKASLLNQSQWSVSSLRWHQTCQSLDQMTRFTWQKIILQWCCFNEWQL